MAMFQKISFQLFPWDPCHKGSQNEPGKPYKGCPILKFHFNTSFEINLQVLKKIF